MQRYLISVFTGLADHLPVVFIETPLISVVKEESNMLDYGIYYFVCALSLTILLRSLWDICFIGWLLHPDLNFLYLLTS